MRNLSKHAEWLNMVEVSGPFLSPTMLEKAFPQGLEAIDTPRRQRLRAAYEEWRDAVDEDDPQLAELHGEWTRMVLEEILEYDREVVRGREDFRETYICRAPDCGVTFVPDRLVMVEGDERPRLFISITPPGTDLEKIQSNDGWPIPLVERMILLCRTTGVRLGLVTNGERWMLINAPVGSPSSHASWYSRLWFQEPVTFKAFLSLLGIRRFFCPAGETLDALLDESLKHSEEVTDTLGEQVRRAVEVLVQCLDKADQDRNRELLSDVSPTELYEAGLTVMMRLVFVLCAEERGLLLLGDSVYDQNYAVSTLRGQLAEEADRHGREVLDRRHDAWARLLAVFRGIYAGMEHESLHLPALGGSLFDPDRFPFLEGRAKGTSWHDTAAIPLPIDNRTVLLLLEALQLIEQQGGALLLSYKALDVENIGHVYEGLLEHTVARVPGVMLGLVGSQKARNPKVSLLLLEQARATDEKALRSLLLQATQRSESAIGNALAKSVDETLFGQILVVCGGDTNLTQRILPFANLLRVDAWGEPIVYRANSFMVTVGADRRETGTHYTPKFLTETIVAATLEPVVYVGPAEGKAREEWRLKSPAELQALKICDPAMGSGAFLVQACRWLSERLVEAWSDVEKEGRVVTVDGETRQTLGDVDPMPSNPDDRLTVARRLIAEKCLYGVDINPLAVELAKLSIWLVTMAKGYPFGFLDHNLRNGDSLLGVCRLDQLLSLSMKLEKGRQQPRLFSQNIEAAVKEVIELRNRLRTIPIRDIRDVETMASMDEEAHRKLATVRLIADAIIGETLRSNGNVPALESRLNSLALQADDFLNRNETIGKSIAIEAAKALSVEQPSDRPPRKPFHWPLEFPEVFEHGGFDGIIGNPPFMGGKKITGSLGTAYRNYAVSFIANGARGCADLCAYFFLRYASLIRPEGQLGLLATNTISQGDTREVGLQQLESMGFSIPRAVPSSKWPGKAQLEIAQVWLRRGEWQGKSFLDNRTVSRVNSYLSHPGEISGTPFQLAANQDISFQGFVVLGMGFILETDEAQSLMGKDERNQEILFPFLNGEDFNLRPDQSPSRWIINFHDWPLMRREITPSWEESSGNKKREWLKDGVVPLDYPGRVAGDYPDCYSIVLQKVKPEREKSRRRIYKDNWWQYAERQPKMRSAIREKRRVICIPETTKYLSFSFCPKDIVFSHALRVIALDGSEYLALLSSTLHQVWAMTYSSTLKTWLKYITSDAFVTFPFPLSVEPLRSIGEKYYSFRKETMISHGEGLTKTYNRLHDPKDISDDIQILRNLHAEMDRAVAGVYDWNDLALNHDFRETKQGIRYTISDKDRTEVLRRLLDLNHERYREEFRQGLHKSKVKVSWGDNGH